MFASETTLAPGLSTFCSFTRTRPARIRARARSRLATRLRSTSRTSMRVLFAADKNRRCSLIRVAVLREGVAIHGSIEGWRSDSFSLNRNFRFRYTLLMAICASHPIDIMGYLRVREGSVHLLDIDAAMCHLRVAGLT